jgi:hypothetical protein
VSTYSTVTGNTFQGFHGTGNGGIAIKSDTAYRRFAGNTFTTVTTEVAGDYPILRADLPVVPTAKLPAAAPYSDGMVLIEDGGSGKRNLIIYGGGRRFRIDGGSAF